MRRPGRRRRCRRGCRATAPDGACAARARAAPRLGIGVFPSPSTGRTAGVVDRRFVGAGPGGQIRHAITPRLRTRPSMVRDARAAAATTEASRMPGGANARTRVRTTQTSWKASLVARNSCRARTGRRPWTRRPVTTAVHDLAHLERTCPAARAARAATSSFVTCVGRFGEFRAAGSCLDHGGRGVGRRGRLELLQWRPGCSAG